MPRVLVSRTFQRQFDRLPADDRERVRAGLSALADDPYTARSGADIKRLEGTDPPKHRLRIGDLRVIYHVDEAEGVVKAIEVFRRGRGYRE